MNKATDKELGTLHAKLAKAMLDALDASDEAQVLLNETDPGDMPDAVIAFLEKAAASNPALLTAVSKFLKDNDITCSVEDSPELSALEQRLKSKPRKSVGNVIALPDSDE